MSTLDRTESLIRRVEKLLDKAARTANPHEADAFARKAAELVAEHRIDPDHLYAGATGDDDLVLRDIALGRGAYVRARLALLTAVAEANDVRVVFRSTEHGTIAHVAGFTSDVEVVEVMYQSLHSQAAAHMASIRRNTGAATQRFRRSFLFGYADRIAEILADARATTEADIGASSSSTSLALRARSERVEDFAAESFGRVRTARAPSAAQANAWAAGVNAAEGADVGRGRLAGRRALGSGQR
ncbi:MAG: DUF2786 domain-containing protein [Ilumatobacteraceae bacterium]